ncbi:MAG: hypothetical protein HC894_19780, partial [Microcoleus sp. SM1_3_4]|nr:hypothetical protein [Microcoleus sp. SM1_3_4]
MIAEGRKKEEGRRKKEEGRGKREEGRGKREEGRRKREEGRGERITNCQLSTKRAGHGGTPSASLRPYQLKTQNSKLFIQLDNSKLKTQNFRTT